MIDLLQPLPPLVAARTVNLTNAARLVGCHPKTLYRARDAGELTVIQDSRTRHRVALVDLSLWYLKNSRNLSTTTPNRVGRPLGKRSVSPCPIHPSTTSPEAA